MPNTTQRKGVRAAGLLIVDPKGENVHLLRSSDGPVTVFDPLDIIPRGPDPGPDHWHDAARAIMSGYATVRTARKRGGRP